MIRLPRVARVGVLLCLALLCAFGVACKKSSSKKTPTNVIDASGGDGGSVDGFGGSVSGSVGAGITLDIYYDGGSTIEVLDSGSVDASFTPTALFSPDLGSNPLVVANSLTVSLVVAEPAAGVVYVLENDSNLYVSDGDTTAGNEPPVTGVQINSGVVLTLALNMDDLPPMGPETAGLVFTDDFVNDGIVTVDDLNNQQRGGLDLTIGGDYIGSGLIRTFGTAPGQNGGAIAVFATGNFYNGGNWSSYGADVVNDDGGLAEPGGNGGDIEINALSIGATVENTGDFSTYGGRASGPDGGDGGEGGRVYAYSYAALWNSGDIDTFGGEGVDDGGRGGDIELASQNLGEVRNTGDVNTSGGEGQNEDGGGAGYIDLEAYGGDLRSSGVLLARGGAGSDVAGDGGEITLYTEDSDDNEDPEQVNQPAGDIWASGGLVATGGNATTSGGSGGRGGAVSVTIDNESDQGSQSIHLLGFASVASQGGAGGAAGGDGLAIFIDVSSDGGLTTGVVNVVPPMNASGGDADPSVPGSSGGDAGDISIRATQITYVTATADGGTGVTAGTDGTITPQTVAP